MSELTSIAACVPNKERIHTPRKFVSSYFESNLIYITLYILTTYSNPLFDLNLRATPRKLLVSS